QGGGSFGMSPPTANTLSDNAWRNWLLKHRDEVFARWLHDLPRGHETDPQFAAGWPPVEAQLKGGLTQDAQAWGGWRSRHGGLWGQRGDRAAGPSGAGTDIATGVFLVLFAGCMWMFVRQALAALPVPAKVAALPEAKPRRAAARRR